jgi:ubiquinone biosynthesis protein COQ9
MTGKEETNMGFINRIKNAIRAFKGDSNDAKYVSVGIDVKRCIDCERAQANPFRDDLLVTAGTRAAYMSVYENIILPDGIDGESEIAEFIAGVVDYYINNETGTYFDDYIERKLIEKYGI